MNRKARRAAEVSAEKTRQQFFAAIAHHQAGWRRPSSSTVRSLPAVRRSPRRTTISAVPARRRHGSAGGGYVERTAAANGFKVDTIGSAVHEYKTALRITCLVVVLRKA
jgi:hypothetical protein